MAQLQPGLMFPAQQLIEKLNKTMKAGGTDAGNNAAEYINLTSDGGYILFNDTDEMATGDSNSFGFMKLAPL